MIRQRIYNHDRIYEVAEDFLVIPGTLLCRLFPLRRVGDEKHTARITAPDEINVVRGGPHDHHTS